MRFKIVAILAVFAFSTFAFAGNVLIQNGSWGVYYPDENDMAAVFGTYSEYNFSTGSGVFTAGNRFVMIEGGDGEDGNFQAFLTANQSTILNWVGNGGALYLQSAAWSAPAFTFGPGTIGAGESDLSPSGTLTAAGIAAFTFVPIPANWTGNYLAHDDISGAGLTVFMTSDGSGNPIVAGMKYGNGYIMYSGLTPSNYHYEGGGLVQDIIAYTAGQAGATPEPGTLVMLGTGLLGLAGAIRRKINL